MEGLEGERVLGAEVVEELRERRRRERERGLHPPPVLERLTLVLVVQGEGLADHLVALQLREREARAARFARRVQDRGQQLRALRAREEVRRRRHLKVAVHRAAVGRVGLSAAARLGELGVAVLALAQLSHLAAKLGRLVDDHALLDLGLELRRHPDALGLLGQPAQPGPDHEEELPAAARVRDQLGLQADVRRLDARHEQLG